MEIENNCIIKGSKITMKFLNYFSCFNCKEIGTLPYFLKCNHIYCEKCLLNFNMVQANGNIICHFCYEVTKKEEILPEFEMKLFIQEIKSINDEQFITKYKHKLDFNSEKSSFRNVILFLLKFFSIENKCIIHNNINRKKNIYKRSYLELKNDKFFLNSDNKKDFTIAPLLKI